MHTNLSVNFTVTFHVGEKKTQEKGDQNRSHIGSSQAGPGLVVISTISLVSFLSRS